jgi:hypothetical protein
MPTGRECQCCAEIERVQDLIEEEHITCITEHAVFIDNCLNRNVVLVSIYDYIHTEGPIDDNQPVHE